MFFKILNVVVIICLVVTYGMFPSYQPTDWHHLLSLLSTGLSSSSLETTLEFAAFTSVGGLLLTLFLFGLHVCGVTERLDTSTGNWPLR